MPSGFANGIASCGGPVGSRPSRPATIGRVDGFTLHVKWPPFDFRSDTRKSGNCIASPMSVPKSSFHTGEVEVRKSLRICSLQPRGALPVSVPCRLASAVASSIS